MKNQLKSILLLGTLSALLVSLGSAVAPGDLYLFLIMALVMNLGAYFFSDKLVLRMNGAREVSPEEAPDLHAMVEELARAAELPKPKVYVIADDQPNAFATGRNPKHGVVAVTEGIMAMLDRRELRGVIAHELAHIKNRDILVSTLAAIAASVVSSLAQSAALSGLFGSRSDDESEGSPSLLMTLVAPLAATLIQMGISRSREFMADELGAKISGDPEALARALAKLERGAAVIPPHEASPATASLYIVNPFQGAESVTRWFSTHPSTQQRVERLLALRDRSRSAPNLSFLRSANL